MDEYIADSGRKKLEKTLKAAGTEVTFYTYAGTHHWFFENNRLEYNPQSGDLAWQRTLDFLNKYLP